MDVPVVEILEIEQLTHQYYIRFGSVQQRKLVLFCVIRSQTPTENRM